MRLIDANILRDDFDPEDSMEYDAVGVRYIIDSAPTIDPIRAAGGCRCGECRHRDTTACPAYDAPMGRTSLWVKHCLEGEAREVQDDG